MSKSVLHSRPFFDVYLYLPERCAAFLVDAVRPMNPLKERVMTINTHILTVIVCTLML